MPVLEEDGRPLPESAVIMEFLEERYPEPPLLPPDPADRAARPAPPLSRQGADRSLLRVPARGGGSARASSTPRSRGLDAALAEHPYLGGAEYGLADIAYVPWLLRARDMLGVELDGFPSLSDWLARLEQRPAIAGEVDIVAAL